MVLVVQMLLQQNLPKVVTKEIFELQFHGKNKLFVHTYSDYRHIFECPHHKVAQLSVSTQ